MLITSHSNQAAELTKVPLDPASIQKALGNVPSGVAAVCAEVDGAPIGFVASSFSVGISFEPPLVLFSVQNSSTTWPKLRSAARIGVSILGRHQEKECLQLASRTKDRFAGMDTMVSESGALFIGGAACFLECTVMAEIPAGDHHIVLLRVRDMAVDLEAEPLIYHRSAFRRLTVPLSRASRSSAEFKEFADDWFFPATADAGRGMPLGA
jgi:flavin reductase (DIM6/NTAB) family NADH-FMN oxidoreductase RutF